jgi:HTH-type transcriptional regulator/antitoxin HigA
MDSTKIKPYKVFPPGVFILEQMECRRWNQSDLSEVLGVSDKTVSLLLKNKQQVSFDMAKLLYEAFGMSVQYWVNLETNYRLHKNRQKNPQEDVRIRSQIYQYMPINEMFRKGWLEQTRDIKNLISQVLAFWKIETLDFSFLDKKSKLGICRQSECYTSYNPYSLQVWFQKAQNIAEERKLNDYNETALKKLIDQIPFYTVKKNGINLFIKQLKACGVDFFVLPHLQKTYLDGAAFYCKKNPVIIYTGRYKREDNFWFTIAHELAHVILHLKPEKKDYFLDNFEDRSSKQEKEANGLAQKILKHQEILQCFPRKINYVSYREIEQCSSENQINPTIVLGTLAYEGIIKYSQVNKYKSNVFEKIDKKYLQDGER